MAKVSARSRGLEEERDDDAPARHEDALDLVAALVHLVDDLARLERDRLARGVVAQGEVADRLVELHADEHAAHVDVGERRAVACLRESEREGGRRTEKEKSEGEGEGVSAFALGDDGDDELETTHRAGPGTRACRA